MKFTQEDLLKALNLKLGDKIINRESGKTYEVCKNLARGYHLRFVDKNNIFGNLSVCYDLEYLIDTEFEIVKETHIGDLTCDEFSDKYDCNLCPIRCLDCGTSPGSDFRKSLYENLKAIVLSDNGFKDEDLYNFLKPRLDKKVEDFKNE